MKTLMNKNLAIFLQVVIVVLGVGALTFLLWEPQIEGRNVGATLFEIYFKDPFLAYAYVASIPFFIALYQAFKLLRNNVFSQASVKALRTIKYCATAIICFAIGAEIIIMLQTSDDRAGGVFMGLLVIAGSGIVAIAAKKFERILQNTASI